MAARADESDITEPSVHLERKPHGAIFAIKVVLYNIDITAMCSVAKCKQSCLIDHLLHS